MQRLKNISGLKEHEKDLKILSLTNVLTSESEADTEEMKKTYFPKG